MKFYVYQLIDSRDGTIFYVGKGQNKRMYQHVKDVKRNKIPNHSNTKLGNKIKKILSLGLKVKYKKIFITENEQKAYDKEIDIIKEIGLENLCNIMVGGKGGMFGRTAWNKGKTGIYSDELRKQMSNSHKGIALSEYHRLSIINGLVNCDRTGENGYFYNKHHTEETKQKMSDAKKDYGIGKNNSQYGTCWVYCSKRKRSMKIKKEELPLYLNEGWIKGRKIIGMMKNDVNGNIL